MEYVDRLNVSAGVSPGPETTAPDKTMYLMFHLNTSNMFKTSLDRGEKKDWVSCVML